MVSIGGYGCTGGDGIVRVDWWRRDAQNRLPGMARLDSLNNIRSMASLLSRIRTRLAKRRPEPKVSETSRCRHRLAPFCCGSGIDVGFGGDPIVPHAICIDLPQPYARYLEYSQHLAGDARSLSWFTNSCLDFVYSSHLLEDFENTSEVVDEWLRVLKVGGVMVLYLPDEQLYRDFCKSNGRQPNLHHIHNHFSLDYMFGVIRGFENVEVIHSASPVERYSFEMVIRKTAE